MRHYVFRDVLEALEHAHQRGVDLYEPDDGELNLIYSQSWDVHTRRTAWRMLLGGQGIPNYQRDLLPEELHAGTRGDNFDLK